MSQTEATETEEPRSSLWKRLLLFVIAPALITGLFSLAPKIYDTWTKPVAALSFTIVGGPALLNAAEYERIFSVSFQNNGSVPLTLFEANFRAENGHLDALSVEKNSLHPESHSDSPEQQTITISRVLPGERLLSAVMVSSSSPTPELTVTSRSNEVVGVLVDPTTNGSNTQDLALLTAAFASASVAAMSLVTVFVLRRRKDLRRRLFEKPTTFKADILTYILGLANVIPLSDEILFKEHQLSYARAADILLIRGLSAQDDVRDRCIRALQALLIMPKINQSSLEKIRDNLLKLGVVYDDRQFDDLRKQANILTPSELRLKVYNLLN
jgi:hypothetical protein